MLFQNVMFGTYTRRQSSGIYQAVLDLETGKLTKPTLLIQTGSPTYTVMSQAGFLYAVNRQNGQGPTGGLGGFNVYDFNNSGEPKKFKNG